MVKYYIWLIVLARLLLPFAPETNLVGSFFSQIDHHISQLGLTAQSQLDSTKLNVNEDEILIGNPADTVSGEQPKADTSVKETMLHSTIQNIWLIWLIAAVALLIHKMTVYQSFVKYMKAGQIEVTDIELWER